MHGKNNSVFSVSSVVKEIMRILKWNKSDPIFEGFLDDIYKTIDHCDVYYLEGQGYTVLNHCPKYHLYQKLGIAEIQDVFVLPYHRGQGVATALIQYCETQCKGDMIGISVPVSPQFGVAQRLYAKLGYMPDGNGVTYDREPLKHNSSVKLDEHLCLMMVKNLK